MEAVNLPVGKAIEPNEEACQPTTLEASDLEAMTPKLTRKVTKKIITFAEDTDTETCSQKSSTYKDVLSQPAPELSHKGRLEWLQQRRRGGLWAQCDACDRWRFLPHVLDRYELPQNWYCQMNPDPAFADCSIPETPIRVRDEEDLIHGEYAAGSLVWARMAGYPWWPAMVCDCPDTEQYYWLDGFSDIPTHYNVVFFDGKEVTRSWIAPKDLKPYAANKDSFQYLLKDKKYKNRFRTAVKQAENAVKLPIAERLEKYSFVARYTGTIISPKTNKKELKKQRTILKRKLQIQFEESDSDFEDRPSKMNGVKIILGTRKSPNKKSRKTSSLAKNKGDSTDTGILKKGNKVVNKTATKEKTEKIVEDRDETDNTSKRIKVDKTVEKTNTFVESEIMATQEKNTENTVVESTTETNEFKEPTSLAVQVGSNNDSMMIEEPFDDDTSKTYIPEKESQDSTQLTENSTPAGYRNFEVVIASPSSDDFEY